MARQFTLHQGASPRSALQVRVAAVAGIIAIAVLAKACGDSKPRVADIPQEQSAAPVSQTPMVQPASAREPVQPEITGPVSFSDGKTAFEERRYEQAAALFIAYSTQHPDNAWGHYMLGLSEWKSGQPERAITSFETALSKDSTHRKAWFNLTRVLLETGKKDEAVGRAERAVQLDSTNAEAWRLFARALSEVGRRDEAITAYRHALALDEKDSWSMNNLGMLYLQAGRYTEALPPLARATELAPERALFQNNLGLVLERTGQISAAATAYQAAVAADSTHAKAVQSLARVQGRKQAEDIVPVDLAAAAKSFADEIGRWKEEMAVVVKE